MIKFSLANENIRLGYEDAYSKLRPLIINKDKKNEGVLGWLEPEDWLNKAELDRIQHLADEIRRKCDTLIVLGIGGSNNGARAAVHAMQSADDKMEIVWGATNLSAFDVQNTLKILEEKNCCLEVIAKNFETLEPGSWFRVLRAAMEKKYGPAEAASRIICCGTEKSRLWEIAQEENYSFIPFPADIGGRFSFLCPVGLLPVAVAGLDIYAMAEGAREERQAFLEAGQELPAAWRYAAFRKQMYDEKYAVELLAFFEPRLTYLAWWWKQLFAESEGKDGKGLFPQAVCFSEDLHSVGQFIQQGNPIIAETFIKVADPGIDVAIPDSRVDDAFSYLEGKTFNDLNKAAEEATILAHSEQGVPAAIIEIAQIDEKNWGALLYFYQIAVYLSGELLGINPFDQPGVEAYKHKMFSFLGK